MKKKFLSIALAFSIVCSFTACMETGSENSLESEKTTHILTKIDAVEGDCKTDGNNEYYLCNECGKAFTDQTCTVETTAEEQKKKGEHKYTNSCDATCNVEGCEEKRFAFHMDLDQNEICDTCGEDLDFGSGEIELPDVEL